MTTIDLIAGLGRRVLKTLTPSTTAWRGAASGVYVLGAVLLLAFFASNFMQDFTVQKLPAFVAIVGILLAFGALGILALRVIGHVSPPYRMALFLVGPFVVVVAAPGGPWQSIAFGSVLLLIASFIGVGIAVMRRDDFHVQQQKPALAVFSLGVIVLAGGLYAIFSEKDSHNPLLDDYVLADRTLALPNPGLPGEHDVQTLSYGSGKDRHRTEYAAGADLIARTVDGSRLIDNWDGISGWLRTSYWGFDVTELPLQGRVWYPQGDGPFPLVLIVHGNHTMEDFSDPGYGYLGELFASRGIILASVDENFVNFAISALVEVLDNQPGLHEENDARGWLLLEHLAQWRDWNGEAGHRFHNKVDMDRVALIGHSRGGEAVAVAASFNALERYPDDASLEFDYGFNLRGVIAIAPVDGQYEPRDSGTPIRDVNYFTIHGSMDADVQSFQGSSQYSRVTFPAGIAQNFKASLYVTGANHGQFNTTWGNRDTGIFSAWTLDFDNIMDGAAQRDVARVFFSAFMEIVLRDRREYLPVFADARHAANWLPDTYYIGNYAGATQQAIASFEEDIDPATTTLAGGRIDAAHLSKWHETRVTLKYRDPETHAGVYAWDKRYDPETANVSFHLPDNWQGLQAGSVIVASISTADIDTLPDDWEENSAEPATADEDEEAAPLDWTVRLVDHNGQSASLPLSHDEVLYPLLQAVPRRASFLDDADSNEILFRRFSLPVADFVAVNRALDPAGIAVISFVFDRSDKGAIIVDDLSLAQPL